MVCNVLQSIQVKELKSEMTKPPSPNPLSHIQNFPDPAATLRFSIKPLDQCLKEGAVILDANALLLPLTTSKVALTELRKRYETLIVENRLYIPTHAFREYLANRPTKIKELIDQLHRKRDRDYSSLSSPLLEQAESHKALTAAEDALREKSKLLAVAISKSIDEVRGWETNDPVSRMYKEIGLADRFLPDPIDFQVANDQTTFLAEHAQRVEERRPPGFKDSTKEENNIGDFLIWKTILKFGELNKGRDATFISGEIKTDWVYRTSNQSLHAREELIEEYRSASDGGSFHLIDLATFLAQLDANPQVVAEVRSSETMASMTLDQLEPHVSVEKKSSSFIRNAPLALSRYVASFYPDAKFTEHSPTVFIADNQIVNVAYGAVPCFNPVLNGTTIRHVLTTLSSLKPTMDNIVFERVLVFVCKDKMVSEQMYDLMEGISFPVASTWFGFLTPEGTFVLDAIK